MLMLDVVKAVAFMFNFSGMCKTEIDEKFMLHDSEDSATLQTVLK